MTGIKKLGYGMQVSDELLKSVYRQDALLGALLFGPRRKGHHTDRVDPVERAAFEAWKTAYERLQEAGYTSGWLVSGYEPDEIDPPRGEWVWDETEEDFAARLESERRRNIPTDGTVTFPIVRSTDGQA